MGYKCTFFINNGFPLGRFFVSLSDILPLHIRVWEGSALSAHCSHNVSEPYQLMF
jgi:hypothetical protein